MILVVLAACTWQISTAQNVTQVEYFFDSDPGFGNGTQVTVTPSTNIVSLAFNANVASLSNGMHMLFVRSKDANGAWSITNSMSIAKVQPVSANPHSATNIGSAIASIAQRSDDILLNTGYPCTEYHFVVV